MWDGPVAPSAAALAHAGPNKFKLAEFSVIISSTLFFSVYRTST